MQTSPEKSVSQPASPRRIIEAKPRERQYACEEAKPLKSGLKKAVFLDRDGTVIFDRGYISDPDDVILIPQASEALRRLASAGYTLVIVSNQSGIGRGYFGVKESDAVCRRLRRLLEAESVILDGIYICPHRPEDSCLCRKPAPGLILKAASELGLDVQGSAVVGDKESDAEAGLAAGCPLNIRLAADAERVESAFPVFHSLLDAADYIINGLVNFHAHA